MLMRSMATSRSRASLEKSPARENKMEKFLTADFRRSPQIF
jgi:hypothetical protein